MKNIYLLSLITLFFFACNENTSTNENKNDAEQKETTNSESTSFNKYPIKAGIVKYLQNAMGEKTYINLYFKNYGTEECIISQIEIDGEKINKRNIAKSGYLYSLEMTQKTGTKIKTNSNLSPYKTDLKILEAKLTEDGGEKLGTEEILGKTCQIYSMNENGANTKIWIWKTMILKKSTEQNGMTMTMEAKSLEETSNLPKGIFDVPTDFTITEEAEMDMDVDDFGDENAAG